MKKTLTLLVLAVGLTASAPASYRIGQQEIPAVEIKSDAASFEVHSGHPRLFFRDTDLPAIRERIAGDYQSEWRE
ncbi:MAG TPA: hypothetical protein VEA63_12960, partial [Opitutus sp.]|nr:hypothetical protein [Opitutus sp.]